MIDNSHETALFVLNFVGFSIAALNQTAKIRGAEITWQKRMGYENKMKNVCRVCCYSYWQRIIDKPEIPGKLTLTVDGDERVVDSPGSGFSDSW